VSSEAEFHRPGRVRRLALLVVAVTYFGISGALVRAAENAAERILEGKKLFEGRCGFCHLPGGTGTIMLAGRLGKNRSLLAERTDLTAAYIRKVTRVGINGMPPHNRIELPDSELDLIVSYLTRPTSARTAEKAGSTGGAP